MHEIFWKSCAPGATVLICKSRWEADVQRTKKDRYALAHVIIKTYIVFFGTMPYGTFHSEFDEIF